ncbi:serine/threonine-protein kinase [Frankia sp. Cr2]|uniref:serine/threonine-protein kinase n=1 Tax=Frankia sp. Cr2 TaxID=3073932 RepID=UPI002AD28F70|nr:protein kinase [Frankia sp. Cr2]
MISGYESFTAIAQGGFSTVYSAYQVGLDRTVAIKVINADLRDSAAERRFRRECRATGRLTGHPHIITIFQTGATQERRPFIAMQYLARGSVSDRLQKAGPMPVHETLLIGAKVAGAMHAAHGAGIIHRDVKPGNILLSDTDEPVLSDFGIASLTGVEGSTSQEAFTPSYTAPEILQGEEPSVATDVYALGATLFTMLAGSPPFGYRRGDNPASIVLRALTQDVPALPRGDVPESVENLLRTALARDPAKRPPTADSFAADLRQLYERLGHTVPRMSPEPVGTPEDVMAPADAASPDDVRGQVGPPADAPATPEDPAPNPAGETTRSRPRSQAAPADHSPAGPVIDSDGDRHESGPMQERTVVRERRPPRPKPAAEPSDETRVSKRRRILLTTGMAASAIIALFVVMAVRAPQRPNPTSSPSPTLLSTPAPITSADLQAARPSTPDVTDMGTVITLRWRNGSRPANLVVQTAAPADSRQVPVQPLSAGAAVTEIPDLDPARGYCFRVGAVLAVGSYAWSDYRCIRGATPPRP